MKLGVWHDALAPSLVAADRVYCYGSNVGGDVGAALQARYTTDFAGRENHLIIGGSVDEASVDFSASTELGALDLYLEIEKVRFGERLSVVKDIEPRALDALVPSLILQPLIENAIKYAISPSEEGGTLKISAKVQGDILFLQVADNGPGLRGSDRGTKPPAGPGGGVGLRNTRARLQQFFGDRQAFTLASNEPSGLVITMNIPFETDEEDPRTDR